MIKTISFYCKPCGLDQERLPVENSYSQEMATELGLSQIPRWYEARCEKCNAKVLRYITDKHLDPYFRLSKKLKIEREKNKKDLLQYGQDGFQTLYPESYKKFQEVEEKIFERRELENKKKNEFLENSKDKKLAIKVLDLEEKLSNGRK